MTTFLRAALALLCLCAAHPALADEPIEIKDAYARILPGATAGAIFMTIENHGASEDHLIATSADIAELAEPHAHTMNDDGTMHMGKIDGALVIPAQGSHQLVRGGEHIMLMGLSRVPAQGDSLSLTLTFEHAGSVTVDVPVDNQR